MSEPTPRALKQFKAHHRYLRAGGRCSCGGCTSFRERFPTYDDDPAKTVADRAANEHAGTLLGKLRGVS